MSSVSMSIEGRPWHPVLILSTTALQSERNGKDVMFSSMALPKAVRMAIASISAVSLAPGCGMDQVTSILPLLTLAIIPTPALALPWLIPTLVDMIFLCCSISQIAGHVYLFADQSFSQPS